MKIVHLIFDLNTGGAEAMLVDIVNEQVKQAEAYLIIVNNDYNNELLKKIDSKINIILINRKPGSRNPFSLLRLNLILFKIKPDVIHCHDVNLINTLLPLFRKQIVITIHGLGLPTSNLYKCKKVFAISNGVALDIKKLSNIDAIVLYNGIYIHKIVARSLFKKNDLFKIVQVGRLSHLEKGQHLLIEAIKILKEKYSLSNVTADFIGEGSSEEFLKHLSAEYNLNKEINFLGLKNRDYVYSKLCEYDLLVQPSLYEGFGLTIVEAMAAKIPVLVSNIDGPMEIIDNGKYGFWFEKGNPEHLADMLKQIIETDNKLLTDKISEAYDFVKEKFNVVNTANNYLKNYEIC